MEFIKKNLVQLREQLKNLSLSQKLLFVMILAVMAICIFWTISWTAQPEMVAMLDQSLSDTEIARIQNKLDQSDAYYKVTNGRILVKRQDRDRLIARLQMDRALPADMTESWKKLILEADMWLPQEDRQNRWQLAKEQRLAQIVQYMDKVQQAYVIVNAGSKRLLSDGPSSDPSASVSIQMEPGTKPNKALIIAIADMVSGAVDRLSRDRVSIIADGVSYKVPGENSPFTGDLLENRQENERYFAKKIEQALGINKALVEVFVDMETETVQTEMKKYGEPPLIREKTSDDSSEQKNINGEPGVRPNTGSSVAVGEPGGEKTSKTETENEYSVDRDVTHTIKHNLPGTPKSLRATINVPYSYFADIYKQRTGKTEKPKESDLEPIIASETKNIQNKILPLINPADPASVTVSYYYDLMPTQPPIALASTGTASLPQLAQYGKPAGLVLLAFGSLVMVLMMLRKASGNVAMQGLEGVVTPNEPTPMLDGDIGPVGEAAGSEGVLQGVEVDEETLRTRKMSEQVSTMVREDPDSAASLVRQWIIKDK
ncbi:MAG: flagellar M-ring protein FliF C-terminal domain-containing protein [Phycisphaerae bacterium]